MNTAIQRIPLLRVLLPLIAGLCIYIICKNALIVIAVLCLVFASVSFLLKKYNIRIDLFCYLIITIIAYSNTTIQNYEPDEIPRDSYIVARINDITDKEASMKVSASIMYYLTDDGTHPHHEKIDLSIHGNNYLLHPGNIIGFKNQLENIKNQGNPDEFDYQKYCNNKHIFNTQYLKNDEYRVLGESHTIQTLAVTIRNKLTSKILSQRSLSANSQNFLITILLGSKEYFDQDIKEAFANIGIAHLLALSGLHVGILVLLIYFLLFPLDYIFNKKVRMGITMSILILYAIITGLSASVSRATLLFAFGFAALSMNRKINSYNILCAAAIILLTVNPNNIYDVGCQLSFISVLSILIIGQLTKRIKIENRILNYLINLIVISISAVIGTGIISAYYFNTFPLLFIIPNVVIIPILPFILIIGIGAIIFDSTLMANIFNPIYKLLEKFVLYMDSLPYSNVDNIYVSGLMLTLYFIVLLLIISCLFKRKYKFSAYTLLGGIVIFIIVSYIPDKACSRLIIFNDYKFTPILMTSENESVLLPDTDKDNYEQFIKYHKLFIAKNHIKHIDTYYNDTYFPCIKNNNTIRIDDKTIRIVTSSKDNEYPIETPVDYLVITKKYYGKIEKLIDKYNPELIILSGDIYRDRREDIIERLQQLNVSYYDLSSQGAFILK